MQKKKKVKKVIHLDGTINISHALFFMVKGAQMGAQVGLAVGFPAGEDSQAGIMSMKKAKELAAEIIAETLRESLLGAKRPVDNRLAKSLTAETIAAFSAGAERAGIVAAKHGQRLCKSVGKVPKRGSSAAGKVRKRRNGKTVSAKR